MADRPTAMVLTRVAPVGERPTLAFVNPGGMREISLPIYPEEDEDRGERLRALRVRLGLGLRGAARALAWSALELSGVERGALRPEVPGAGATAAEAEIERVWLAALDGLEEG